jgi:predicted permease
MCEILVFPIRPTFFNHSCGEASVPLTLLTLGATLHKTLMRRSDLQSNHAEHAAANRKVMRAVLFVCFARLIVMAAVGVGAAFAARRYGVALALEDPLVSPLRLY